jgi:hypothetical protein
MNLAMPEDRPRLQSSFLNRSQSELRAVMERENEINKSRGGPKLKHYVDLHERRIASMAKEQKRREHEDWAFSRSSIWQHGHVEHLPGGASGSTVGSSAGLLGPAHLHHDGGELVKGETNLFSNETAAPRETVLRPKSEATSFYENRPWTPTTGEDYLLAAPKGFHPSSSLYPRRQGKAQKFVGARRASYYIDEQPPTSQSSPLRLKPMAIQPFCDNGFISMQASRQARAEILIKDHKRGVMTEYPALKDPSFSFASLALTLETEILEFTSDAARTDELRPSLAVTNKSLEMLDRIADFPGPFQKILLYVRETLQDAIFASTDALISEKSSPRSISRTTSDRDSSRQESKPYFWLFQKTSAELEKMKHCRSSPENEKLEAESDDAQAMSPDATLSSKKSNHEPKKDIFVEEKYAEKIRALQNEKLGMEEIMQELALQNNTYIWDLEEKSSENTKLYQEAAQLKASFLRIKSDCMDARAEAAFVNTLNERNFHQLQSSITRSEHERVVQEYEGQLAAQHEKFSRMMEEHHGDGGKKVADAMKTMTPRPTWRRTGLSKQILVDCSVFPRTMSSAESVDKLLQGFSSLQTNFTNLKVKLAELEGAEEKVADESHSWGGMKVTNSIITCMGLSEDVPEFLRFSGQVRNLKMRKGDAEKWVRTIWAAKAEIDTARQDAGDERLDLATFFRNWVIKKFNDHEVKMAEWTYNLIVTVRGNCHDTDLDLFLKILLKEISEDVYHDEKDQMEDAMILAKQVKSPKTCAIMRIILCILILYLSYLSIQCVWWGGRGGGVGGTLPGGALKHSRARQ